MTATIIRGQFGNDPTIRDNSRTTAKAAIVTRPPAKLVLRPEVVRAAMVLKNITSLGQLAEITGVSLSTVKRSMAGQEPSTAFIAGLWARLGLSPDRATTAIDPTAKRR